MKNENESNLLQNGTFSYLIQITSQETTVPTTRASGNEEPFLSLEGQRKKAGLKVSRPGTWSATQ